MSKTSTLVERLRHLNPWKESDWPERCREAADRITALEAERDSFREHSIELTADCYTASSKIEELQAERDALRKALEPFAKIYHEMRFARGKTVVLISGQSDGRFGELKLADFRRARAALSPPPSGHPAP